MFNKQEKYKTVKIRVRNDNKIVIDFELPKILQYLVNDAEEADLLEDYGLYMNLADMIDSEAKKNVTHNIIQNMVD